MLDQKAVLTLMTKKEEGKIAKAKYSCLSEVMRRYKSARNLSIVAHNLSQITIHEETAPFEEP